MKYPMLNRLQHIAAALALTAFGHSAHAVDAALQVAPADGWASQAGGTQGGSAATTANIYTVSNRAQLLVALSNGGSLAKIIKVVGTIDMSEGVAFSSHADQATRGAITLPANTSLIGDAANAGIVNGYVNVSGVSQVIIRNLKIVAPCDVTPVWDATEGNWVSSFQAVQVSASNHVWIDHNTFTDTPVTNDTLAIDSGKVKECHDGALDIKNASDYVTVSYNLFSLHNKNNLVGASDSAVGDAGHLTVTFSNNVFSNVTMRTPRVRYGQVHLFNNYYTGSKSHPVYPHSYSVGAGVAAKILSNNNAFEIAGASTCDDVVTNPNSSTAAGAFKDTGSVLNGAVLAGCLLSNNVTWTVPYAFTPRPVALVKANALAQSGGGKLTTTVTGTGSTSSSSSVAASSSSSSVTSALWSEPFSAASSAIFFSSAYAAQPGNIALYAITGGSGFNFSGGTLTLVGSRFSVGAASTIATTASSAPAGIFDFAGKTCSLTVVVSAASGTGLFQIAVNNNTTSASASPLGSASRVVSVAANALTIGTNVFTWSNVGSSTSFLHFRTESAGSVTIDNASLSCTGGTSSSSSSVVASSSSSSSVVSSSSSSSVVASSSSSSSIASSSSSSTSGGPVATTSGGYATTMGGNIAGARFKTAATMEDMIAIIAAARINDAGQKVTAGAYPLVITYTGNEDDKIAQIVADHTIDANHNCPNPHWNDAYREVSLKEFTAGLTIIGANGSSANFGITIVNGGNVVIRNMKIGALAGANNDADMIRVDNSPNVWIDHNELFAVNNECNGSPDGDLTFESAIDIKKNSDNVTVSYNYIHDSKKVGLDGHTASSGLADFQRHITYHHNVYNNVNGRLPLQRGGWIHAYNNLYANITSSGINVRSGGNALIENNWFENSINPVTCRYDTVNCGKWDLRGNNLTSSADNATYGITWDSPGTGGVNADSWTTTGVFPITLSYVYTPETPACVKANLASVAGVGKGLATLTCN